LVRRSIHLQGFHSNIEHRKRSKTSWQTPFCVEDLALDATELLGFETIEFFGEKYLKLVKDVGKDLKNLPDLKIE